MRLLLVVLCVLAFGCERPPPKTAPNKPAPVARVDLAAHFDAAMTREAIAPEAYEGYLRVVEHAVLQRDDPWAPAAAMAALDALIWRSIALLPTSGGVVYRSHEALTNVTQRLRTLWPHAWGSVSSTSILLHLWGIGTLTDSCPGCFERHECRMRCSSSTNANCCLGTEPWATR